MQALPCLRLAAALALLSACGTLAAAVLPYENTGHLYVSMWSADEVAVFTRDGEPVTRFTADGLDGPRGLAFHPDKDELWVAGEFSDALYVFEGEHQLLRTIRQPDLDGPVGITFAATALPGGDREILVSNSDGDEILVLSEDGTLLRRFDDPSLRDPGCSALMPDGSLFVANRLGGSTRTGGAVARFGADEVFAFDFTTAGLASTMAVARDPNVPGDPEDDTLWVTSGAGTLGIHEFDVSGNLLRSILPDDISDGDDLVPQGIAFADDGHFFVVSYGDAVYEFDGDGRFLSSFPTGPGTSRSTAFRRCDADCDDLAGTSLTEAASVDASTAETVTTDGSSGGGAFGVWMLAALLVARRTYPRHRRANLESVA